MEITELNFDGDFGNNNNNNSSYGKSSNFGGGLELLMNDKIKDSRPTSDIELEDLNNLENELNNLVEDIPSSSFKPKSDFFTKPNVSFEEPIKFAKSIPSFTIIFSLSSRLSK